MNKHPIITWFVENPVVANIMMFSLLGAGIFTAFTVRKEGFPAFAAESVTITVPILGGTPENVERGVAIRIEEALQGIQGIDEVRSESSDREAKVTVLAVEGYPIKKLLDDIKVQVDAIPRFPEQAEKPVVKENKRQSQVLWIEVYGDADEAVRKEVARKLRDKLLAQPAISLVETFGAFVLTSLTTFFGLAPLLLEKEVEAQFLKPMAASLAFGIAFATVLTLVLLPLLFLIGQDVKRGVVRYFRG